MHHVVIKQDGGRASVTVDGQDVARCVAAVDVSLRGDSLPEVTLRLVPLSGELDLDRAVLDFDARMPEVLQRALHKYLQGKFGAGEGVS